MGAGRERKERDFERLKEKKYKTRREDEEKKKEGRGVLVSFLKESTRNILSSPLTSASTCRSNKAT